jgi:putative multiple sugar transport system ATP-binding protein
VLRDGKTVDTLDITDAAHPAGAIEDIIIKLMVGRELVDRFPKREKNIGVVGFEIKDWNVYDPINDYRKIISNVNFHSRKGEILGIYGLMGAGRTELALSIFGRSYGTRISGKAMVDGREVTTKTVGEAIKSGIAYATEDRKQAGIILIASIKDNISLVALNKISKKNVINNNDDRMTAEEYRKKLSIRCSDILQEVNNLSGGNQQKVMLSKWIFADSKVLILDEPTRGVDVGAKYEIYTIINELAGKGNSIVMISSELNELLGMCDRIYVLNRGTIVGEVAAEEATPENIMHFIMESNKSEGVRQ